VVDVGTNKVSDRAEIHRLFGDDPVRWKDFEKRGYIWAGDVDETRCQRCCFTDDARTRRCRFQ